MGPILLSIGLDTSFLVASSPSQSLALLAAIVDHSTTSTALEWLTGTVVVDSTVKANAWCNLLNVGDAYGSLLATSSASSTQHLDTSRPSLATDPLILTVHVFQPEKQEGIAVSPVG